MGRRLRLRDPQTKPTVAPVHVVRALRVRCPRCPHLWLLVPPGRTASCILQEHYIVVHEFG